MILDWVIGFLLIVFIVVAILGASSLWWSFTHRKSRPEAEAETEDAPLAERSRYVCIIRDCRRSVYYRLVFTEERSGKQFAIQMCSVHGEPLIGTIWMMSRSFV